MISAAQWEAYGKAVASIADAARLTVTDKVQAWVDANPSATVAEAREAAEGIVKSHSETYNQQAATLAAEWYDAQGKAAGAKLDRAVTSAVVDDVSLRKTVHYQARLLADGDNDGFAAAVGEWAENSAKRAVNDTVLANAKRDRKKGVRFARVTSGRNTCAFCLMLAGRGAVYHSRKSAGEMNRFHRHCSCKVVPSYSGDSDEVLVEGRDPKKIRDRLSAVEKLTGAPRGTSAFAREVELRDPEWLYGGEAADVSFCSEIVSGSYKMPEKHEVACAEKLRELGYRCHFGVDRSEVASDAGSSVVYRGTPDLDNGIELKSLISAKSSSAIDRKLRGAGKKEGLALCVVDNLAGVLPDADCEYEISRKMGKRGVNRVLFLASDGSTKYITT